MKRTEGSLDRLLRAAARAGESAPEEAPFGFETRVAALGRAQRSRAQVENWGFAALVRRVAIGALILTVAAGGGAFWQWQENEAWDEPTVNAYVLADSVIESGTWQ